MIQYENKTELGWTIPEIWTANGLHIEENILDCYLFGLNVTAKIAA